MAPHVYVYISVVLLIYMYKVGMIWLLMVILGGLKVAFVRLARKNAGVIVPGYTHLQRAQPVLLQHHLLAFVEQLERDAERLLDCKARLNIMTSSMEAVVSDLAFVLEFLSANSITAIHLSRLGEEWVLWASEEFGFITPSDSVSTGSSIMPQKKNPDPMELVRGKSARVVGDLVKLQLTHNHGFQVLCIPSSRSFASEVARRAGSGRLPTVLDELSFSV